MQSFTVNDDDDLASVAERLADDGSISDADVFEWYVEREGGIELIPGYYEIRPNDHMGNVLGRLRTPTGQTYTKVTFPEGFTVSKMADRLQTSVDRLSAAEFLAAANSGTIRSSFQPLDVTSLEGMLFPDTYQVSNAEGEGQVLERMIALMERVGDQEDIVNRSVTRHHPVSGADHCFDDRTRGQGAGGSTEDREGHLQPARPQRDRSGERDPTADRRHRAVRTRAGGNRS